MCEEAIFLAQNANKKEDRSRIDRFIFSCNNLRNDVPGNISNMISELVAYVEHSIGQVSDKERKITFVKECVYKIRTYS